MWTAVPHMHTKLQRTRRTEVRGLWCVVLLAIKTNHERNKDLFLFDVSYQFQVSSAHSSPINGMKNNICNSHGEALWETKNTDLRSVSLSSERKIITSFRLSRLLVGSSSSMSGASCKESAAWPMRWRSPPENWVAKLCNRRIVPWGGDGNVLVN